MSRRREPASTRVHNLHDAYMEFLGAPDGEYGTNEGLLLHVLGHLSVKDPATFEPVNEHYKRKGRKVIQTFRDAFNACMEPRFGVRDWRHFNLSLLQECSGLRDLNLPDRVTSVLLAEQEHERHFEHMRATAPLSDRTDLIEATSDSEAAPLELLTRAVPRRARSREIILRATVPRHCVGSKGACSNTPEARIYQAARSVYHRAGAALRRANIRRARKRR